MRLHVAALGEVITQCLYESFFIKGESAMKKLLLSTASVLIVCILFFTTTITIIAEDLPIDINAINRQTDQERQITTRIGANLFTRDSQRINQALAELIYIRQATITYLFTEASPNYETDSYTRIMNAAQDLFSQPANFSNIVLPPPDEQISMWIVIPIVALGALTGFVWAVVSRAKKKGAEESVH